MTSVVSTKQGALGVVYPGVDYKPAPQVFGGGATFQQGITTSPTPSVTAPSVPSSTDAATNTTGVDVAVYLATGSAVSITVVKVNGTTTGLVVGESGSAGAIYLPGGATIALTYSGGTPTWVWLAV